MDPDSKPSLKARKSDLRSRQAQTVKEKPKAKNVEML